MLDLIANPSEGGDYLSTLKCQGDRLLQLFQLFCETQVPLLQWERTLARHNVLPEIKAIGSGQHISNRYFAYNISQRGDALQARVSRM